jgi:hypothetical protein
MDCGRGLDLVLMFWIVLLRLYFGVMILARKCNINMCLKLANQTEIETSAVRTNVIFCVVAQVSDIYLSYRLPAEASTHAYRASSDTW